MKIKELFKKTNKEQIPRLIGFIVFILLIFNIFCKVTYLFRQTDVNRNHIVGIKNENLDMVYIGGSAAFVYWQPLKAWNDCGFTSYSYATDTIQAENIKAYIEEVRTTQNPTLFVIGIRAFQYYSDKADEKSEAGLRNGADGMDLTSIARYKLLNDYFSNRTITEDTDVLSYYLDILKYHTNTERLGDSAAWELINNDGTSPDKGWEWLDSYGYLECPTDFNTEERAELPANDVEILTELLEYCKNEELNVLFVVCPYYITAEEYAKYNTIGDMINTYGFDYLNTNDYYAEMEIDFSTDFHNINHVNLFGAEKYTQFLESYITKKYSMPDHRGDSAYEAWNDDYNRYIQEYDTHAATVTNLRLDVEKGNEYEEEMRSTEDFFEWYKIASDARYKLLIASSTSIGKVDNAAFNKILSEWTFDGNDAAQIRVIQDSQVVYSNNANQALTFDGTAGIWNDISYYITVEGGNNRIIINNDEIINTSDGMSIVVYDDNYRRVADAITIKYVNGTIQIERE